MTKLLTLIVNIMDYIILILNTYIIFTMLRFKSVKVEKYFKKSLSLLFQNLDIEMIKLCYNTRIYINNYFKNIFCTDEAFSFIHFTTRISPEKALNPVLLIIIKSLLVTVSKTF